jgi:hypothetical protein
MKDNPHLEYYQEIVDDNAIQFDDLDYAIVGVSHDGLFIYDYDRLVECFVTDTEMTIEEAVEWIDFNVLDTNGGQGFIIMYSNEDI